MSPAWKDRYQPLDTVAETVHSRLIRGVDLVHDRPVALKIRTVHTPDQHASARREARTLLTLQPHPGLPTVRDDFVEGDDYVLVLDWVEGTDLARVLAARGSPGMPPAMVLAWVRDLADAAGHLHRHDPPIIHGDIKPANAILTPTGRVVLVDLGNATDSAVASLGTPGFAAPEVAFGGVATVGADIYGLAATTYALLAGRPPSAGPAVDERLDPTAATIIERALRPALALDPVRRPASAEELIHRIAAWAEPTTRAPIQPATTPQPAAATRQPSQPPTPLVAVTGAVLAVAIISAIGIGAARHPPDRARRFQGSDRYATAAAVAAATFPTAPAVVIARADQPADALAALYLAGAQHAPLLYASPDGLSTATAHALTTIHTHQAFIIGDDTAVSANVADRLTRLGIRTVRVAAPNRYSTAAVITQAGGPPAALDDAGATAIMINDQDAAALSAIGALSYGAHLPVLYTTTVGIPPETRAALAENHIRHVLTAGTLSDQAITQLNDLNVTTQSLGTTLGPPAAARIATFELDTLGWTAATIVLARGDDYPDALAAATRAGLRHAPMLLTDSATALGASTTGFLYQQPPVHELDLIGDPTAIDNPTAQAAKVAAHLPGR